MAFKSGIGLWWGLEVPDWDLTSWSWFGYGHWSLIHPWSKSWLSILILKVQRISISFKSWFGALEDAGVPDWGFASWSCFRYGHWSLMHPWSKFISLYWFWRFNEHPCPWSPHFGLWRTLEVPDWGSASLSWFGYGHWSLIYPWSECWLSILILKVQRTSMSFKSPFGALEDAGGSWLGFGILILMWIWSGTLLWSSLKFWSHSDQGKLRYSQSRFITVQNIVLS